MSFELIGSVFKGFGKEGDFSWMIKQPEYQKTLFIFNDNTEDHTNYCRGGGNAVMRPFNKYNPESHEDGEFPRSAGIPTGDRWGKNAGGFTELDDNVKKIINDSIDEIRELIQKYNYDKVIYSSEKKPNDILGTGIFDVDKEVLEYVTEKIHELKD